DRLFFFGGYQSTRIRNTQGDRSAFVPTAANLTGDFSNLLNAGDPNNPLKRAITLKGPVSGQLFANNQIPVNRFDPAALALVKYLPPASSAGGVAFYSQPIIQNFDEFIARADYSLSVNDRL